MSRIGGFKEGAEGAAAPLFFLPLTLRFCFENRFIRYSIILSSETLTLLYFASRIRPQCCMLNVLKIGMGGGWETRSPLSEFSGSAPKSGPSQEDSVEETTNEEMDGNVEENDWSEDINRREDVEFQEQVGINVDSENLRSYLDFFLLFFTEEVWKLLIVEQSNLHAEQKRGPEEGSVWYSVTKYEMKAWVSLYLTMGLVTKPNLSLYWSTDPALNSPFSLA